MCFSQNLRCYSSTENVKSFDQKLIQGANEYNYDFA